jgi:PIN domain nuclease of toxin-antitoxin system
MFEDTRLSESLRGLIEDAGNACWISPISIWELGLLASRERVRLVPDLREWVREALRSFPLREAPLTAEVALTVHDIDVPHRDPADHLLAATALVYDLDLVTVDHRLSDLDWLPTIS